jgi:hypothetical protein
LNKEAVCAMLLKDGLRMGIELRVLAGKRVKLVNFDF